MAQYRVILARQASESRSVDVEADSPEQANEAALEMAGKYGENLSGWELDDNMHEVYLPDEDSTEEADDDTPLTVVSVAVGHPYRVWVSLGSIAVQEPVLYDFPTQGELDAFLLGFGLTEGWDGYEQFDTAEEAAEYWEEHKTDADDA